MELTGVSGLMSASRCGTVSMVRTRSRVMGPSPAMLPRPQTACSATFGQGEVSSATNLGTPPPFTTAFVCSVVPEATFVRAHAASNCRVGLSQHLQYQDIFTFNVDLRKASFPLRLFFMHLTSCAQAHRVACSDACFKIIGKCAPSLPLICQTISRSRLLHPSLQLARCIGKPQDAFNSACNVARNIRHSGNEP